MRIIFHNADTNGIMEWTFESEIQSRLFVPAIFKTLGEVPEHEYSKNGDFMVIQLNTEQINRMRHNVKTLPKNVATDKFYNDITFLLTCSGPIITR